MTITIGQRRTITAWWVYRSVLAHITIFEYPNCKTIAAAIEEAEEDLSRADRILAEEYEEYTPQL